MSNCKPCKRKTEKEKSARLLDNGILRIGQYNFDLSNAIFSVADDFKGEIDIVEMVSHGFDDITPEDKALANELLSDRNMRSIHYQNYAKK